MIDNVGIKTCAITIWDRDLPYRINKSLCKNLKWGITFAREKGKNKHKMWKKRMLIMDMMPSINLQPRPSLPSPLLSDSMWTDASKCSTAMVFICKTFSPQCCMAGSCSNHGQFSHQLFKETPPTRLPLNHITLTRYPHLTPISPINHKPQITSLSLIHPLTKPCT